MAEPHARLNAMSSDEARAALTRCCGSSRWVDKMLAGRPFASTPQLLAAADSATAALTRADHLQAFAHHPPIGANLDELRRKFGSTAQLSAAEQAGAVGSDEPTLAALRDKNRAYLERFGYIFIVCASGKSAREMLQLLEARLPNDPDTELTIAAAEQAKIAKLRLEKLA
ncbi:MAG TPA: 2-oxo-4-hydroxy-4-carboxy-5-ureidoimidazoline decarboxylase [Polyangiales bacterium]|nr:2-oxo-4-hydroxy-4-carboxy-5-ureidoimidazoline decarboxylase [Polyangiales bacterium]